MSAQGTTGVSDPEPTEPPAEYLAPHPGQTGSWALGPLVTPSTHHPGAGCGAAQLRAQAAGRGGALRCRPWLACPAPATGRAPTWHKPHQGPPQVPVVEKSHVRAHLLLPQLDQQPSSPREYPYSLYRQTTPQLPNPKSTPCTSPSHPTSCPLLSTPLP